MSWDVYRASVVSRVWIDSGPTDELATLAELSSKLRVPSSAALIDRVSISTKPGKFGVGWKSIKSGIQGRFSGGRSNCAVCPFLKALFCNPLISQSLCRDWTTRPNVVGISKVQTGTRPAELRDFPGCSHVHIHRLVLR